jgi:protein MpaA
MWRLHSLSRLESRGVKDRGVKSVKSAERAALLGAVCSLFALGCELSPHSTPHGARFEVFGRSSGGRPIRGAVLGEGRSTYVLFGVIHGNEPLGAPLLERFTELLAERPDILEGKRVVVLPVTNPDGLALGTRANARGVDLNRNFPSRCWTRHRRHGSRPASEDETKAILRVMREFRPDRILTLHSPLNCVNFDGPAHALAGRIAEITGYPLRESIGYPTPGSLGSYAGVDLGIPTITLELGRTETAAGAWERLRPGLLAFIDDRPRGRERLLSLRP